METSSYSKRFEHQYRRHQISYSWAVVTSGPTANSLGVVRNLGEKGIPIVLLDVVPDSPARFSRFVRQRLVCNGKEEDFTTKLVEFGRQQKEKPVLISTADKETLMIANNQELLARYFRFYSAPVDTVKSLVNKKNFYRLLDELDMPHPKTVSLPSNDGLGKAAGKISFPFLVKPTYSNDFLKHFGQKLFVIRNRKQLEKAEELLNNKGIEIVVQELINASVYYEVYALFLSEHGLIACCGFDRLRQFPLRFGTASLCRSVHRPEPIRMSAELISRLQFEGIGAIELIRDKSDGKFKIIELNPRTTLQNRLSAAAGVNIEHIVYRILKGEPVSRQTEFIEGVYWVDNLKNSISKLAEMMERNTSLRVQVRESLRSKVQSVLSWKDPLPILNCWRQSVFRALRWLRYFRMIR